MKLLVSGNEAEILEATHQIWCSLCHQHAYISSAAEPAYPFLRYVLLNADEALLVEMLDIFAGFAVCSSPEHPEGGGVFQRKIRSLLQEDIELFRKLAVIEGEEGFAELIVQELSSTI